MNAVTLRYESGVSHGVRLGVFTAFISCLSLLWLSISHQWEKTSTILLSVFVIVWFVAFLLSTVLPCLGKCALRMEGNTLIIEKSILGLCWRRYSIPRNRLSITCNTRTEIRGAFQSTRHTILVFIPAIRTPQGLIHLPQIHRKSDAESIMMQLQRLLGQ